MSKTVILALMYHLADKKIFFGSPKNGQKVPLLEVLWHSNGNFVTNHGSF